MARPIVYGPAMSPYVWSVRLALAEKGVAHELISVSPSEFREEPHVSRHPFGKVPAFEHDAFALYETHAITRSVDEAFPAARPPHRRDRGGGGAAARTAGSRGDRPFGRRPGIPRRGQRHPRRSDDDPAALLFQWAGRRTDAIHRIARARRLGRQDDGAPEPAGNKAGRVLASAPDGAGAAGWADAPARFRSAAAPHRAARHRRACDR